MVLRIYRNWKILLFTVNYTYLYILYNYLPLMLIYIAEEIFCQLISTVIKTIISSIAILRNISISIKRKSLHLQMRTLMVAGTVIVKNYPTGRPINIYKLQSFPKPISVLFISAYYAKYTEFNQTSGILVSIMKDLIFTIVSLK